MQVARQVFLHAKKALAAFPWRDTARRLGSLREVALPFVFV
jgi:hypothetical protein